MDILFFCSVNFKLDVYLFFSVTLICHNHHMYIKVDFTTCFNFEYNIERFYKDMYVVLKTFKLRMSKIAHSLFVHVNILVPAAFEITFILRPKIFKK